MSRRRQFLAQVGALAGGLAVDRDELRALSATPADDPAWDTSWIARLAPAKHRVVFNASDISDGAALNYASTFLDHFRAVHATSDADTRAVIVFRRMGTVMAFGDALWERYGIGADRKLDDPKTKAPTLRNLWLRTASAPAWLAPWTLEALTGRGVISLVCNVSVSSWSSRVAEATGQAPEAVRAEVLANLAPGAILVPSGIYALIRAQNAGCAFMPGT